jgi:ectoine hydroxylase-related dioxygenase (phytanoyl-CoA dioxygenase family)
MTSLAASRDLSPYVADYQRDGFVHIPGLLSEAEIARFKPIVDAAVAKRTRRDNRPFAARTPYEQSFRQCIHLWVDNPDVRQIDFHPAIAGAAATLLGCAAVRLWHDQALYKEGGGRETEAHQDHAYWPVKEPDMITAWLPLVDVDESNGCMGYVAGTQAIDRFFVDIFNTPGDGKKFAARFPPPRFIPARRGDVIFHAARTVHEARANRTGATRAVHTIVYFKDGCTRDPESPLPFKYAAPGAKIDTPMMPIAWPLRDGMIPEPPAWGETNETLRRFVEAGVLPG